MFFTGFVGLLLTPRGCSNDTEGIIYDPDLGVELFRISILWRCLMGYMSVYVFVAVAVFYC